MSRQGEQGDEPGDRPDWPGTLHDPRPRRRLRPDASWRRPADGDVVLAGSPLTIFRLTAAGRRIAQALERGDDLPPGHERLTDRLLDTGAVHPDVTGDIDRDAGATGEISVIIPVHDEDSGRLGQLVASLSASPLVGEIVVVDDASSAPVTLEGARVLRLDRNAGPAAARNAGVATTSGSVLLFVDADVSFDDAHEVISLLWRHLDDEHVALVAPRIAAERGEGALATFDAVRSPLDLGRAPARVRALTRVSYVPAAAIVVRRTAWRELSGFDESMRFGEDVDFVWRLDAAGRRCRYEPAAVARHSVRPTLRRWLRQRYGYGTSAAPLARRHGSAVAPVRLSRWTAAAWLTGALVHPLLGVGLAAGTTAEFARRLGDIPGRNTIALRYAGLGHLHGGHLIARALTRTWWPLALMLAMASRRARRAVVAAALVPALLEWATERPRCDPVRYVALSLADDVSYGTGVWIGLWHERSLRALAPSLTR